MLDHITELRIVHGSDDPIPATWPSEIVRRAALLMQERAYAATIGPWVSLDGGDRLIHDPGHDLDKPIYVVDEPMSNAANTEHIAALDPVVADLVADAWRHIADDMCDELAHFHAFGPEGNWVIEDEREEVHYDWTATVRAALAYLREQPPEGLHGSGGDASASEKGDLLDLSKTQVSAVLAAERAQDGAA